MLKKILQLIGTMCIQAKAKKQLGVNQYPVENMNPSGMQIVMNPAKKKAR